MRPGFVLLEFFGIILAVSLAISLISLGIWLTWEMSQGDAKDRQIQDQVCQSYCNCTITKGCLYTFDYSDVKDCNCSK